MYGTTRVFEYKHNIQQWDYNNTLDVPKQTNRRPTHLFGYIIYNNCLLDANYTHICVSLLFYILVVWRPC